MRVESWRLRLQESVSKKEQGNGRTITRMRGKRFNTMHSTVLWLQREVVKEKAVSTFEREEMIAFRKQISELTSDLSMFDRILQKRLEAREPAVQRMVDAHPIS